MTVYTVRAEREGKWWGLQCVEVPSALSQSRDLAGAQVIREAIAFIEEIPEYTVAINLDVVLPSDMKSTLDEYRGRDTGLRDRQWYRLAKHLRVRNACHLPDLHKSELFVPHSRLSTREWFVRPKYRRDKL
jgi:hypothetical protein